jgi:hypothetical protein
MTPGSLIDLIGLIHDEFDRRRWRDSGNTARSLAVALMAGQSPGHAAAGVSNRFLLQNDITTDSIQAALERVLRENPLPLRIPRPAVGSDEAVSASPAPSPGSSERRPKADQVPPPTFVFQKRPLAARLAIGTIIVIASAIAVFLVPDGIHWTWLIGHPSRLSLEWGAFFVGLSLAGAVVFWRREFLGVACVPGIIAVVVLLGH